MPRSPICLAILAAACGGALHEAPPEWRDQPPSSPCVATIRTAELTRTLHYGATGAVVFGKSDDATERLTWKDGRLAEVTAFVERPATEGGCEVLGGCPEPAQRTVTHVRYAFDGPRLIAMTSDTRTYEQVGNRWQATAQPHADSVGYRYAGDRLVAIGPAPLTYDGNHVVRYRDTTYAWQGDQLVAARGQGMVRTFAYDAAGRLARETLGREGGPAETHEWTYDDRGRVATALVTDAGATALSTHAWTYTYDAAGRLTAAVNGDARETRTYTGICANDLGAPRPPTALGRSDATACIRTPAGLVDTCE